MDPRCLLVGMDCLFRPDFLGRSLYPSAWGRGKGLTAEHCGEGWLVSVSPALTLKKSDFMREFSRIREVSSVGTEVANCYRQGESGSLCTFVWKLELLEIVRVQDLHKWCLKGWQQWP